MGLIKKIEGKEPKLGKDCWHAETAVLIGEVVCGDECTFWYGAIVRADVNFIHMGNRVNIQDGAVIHCTYQKCGTTIGNNVSVGHNAIVHGCTVHDNVLIGMGAIVMDNAVVGENSIIAAGAVVLENTIVEPNSIYAGVPAKKVKSLDPEKGGALISRTAANYVKYASWFKEEE